MRRRCMAEMLDRTSGYVRSSGLVSVGTSLDIGILE